MSKFVLLQSYSTIVQALCDAGVISEDPAYIRRVVIDLEVGSEARVYVERYADQERLTVALTAGLTVAESLGDAGLVGADAPKREAKTP